MATKGDYADIGYRGTLTFNGDTYKWLDAAELGVGDADSIETTHSGGTNFHKTFMAGLIDAGEVSFSILFDPDAPIIPVRTVSSLVVTLPPKSGQTQGATFTCDAFLKTPPLSVPVGDKMTQQVTFKLTGAPVFAAGS